MTTNILPIPDVPEVWMFWTGRAWLGTIDEVRGVDTFMVAVSRGDAEAVVEDQLRKWGVDCIPVRVKSPFDPDQDAIIASLRASLVVTAARVSELERERDDRIAELKQRLATAETRVMELELDGDVFVGLKGNYYGGSEIPFSRPVVLPADAATDATEDDR